MQVTICEVPANSAADIVPLVLQVQAIHSSAHPGAFVADPASQDVEEFLRAWLQQSGVTALAAFTSDGTAVGYVVFEVQRVPASALKPPLVRGVLHHVSVDCKWRRQSIATRLLEEVRSRLQAAGIRRWRTVYYVFNEPSAALMSKFGLMPLTVVAEANI